MRSILVYFNAFSIVFTSATINCALAMEQSTERNMFGDLIDNGMNLVMETVDKSALAVREMCIYLANKVKVPESISPDIRFIHFYYFTPCLVRRVPITQAELLWDNHLFQKNKKLVIYASGWRDPIHSSIGTKQLAKAFQCRPDVGFMAVDVSDYVNRFYTWSALNTINLGELIAVGLKKLVDVMPGLHIHLVGHSLGAHVMGSAGREFQRLAFRRVNRITGLDPAMPCFKEKTYMISLQRGDADLVDIIHSNPGILGQSTPTGDVDFFPAGLDRIKPGCLTLSCSHSRAIEYFAESVYPGQDKNFLALKCNSYKELYDKKCTSNISTMGYMLDPHAQGVYYADVYRSSPFGKNTPSEETIDLEKGNDKCRCHSAVVVI